MSNLDDFFKKRDKKKKSAKSKFPTLDTDELAKNLEATAIKSEETEQDFQDNNNNLTNNNNLAINDNIDEEWKPYEDENKDLTGLKITFLKQVEDENNDYIGVVDENEKKSSCPWGSVAQNKQLDDNNEDVSNEQLNVKQTALSDSTNQIANVEKDTQKSSSTTQATDTAANESSKQETSNTSTTTNSTASAYVPPALRRQNQTSDNKTTATATTTATGAGPESSKYVPPSMRNRESNSSSTTSAIPQSSVNYRRPNKSQPNINDTMEFPTLDSAGAESNNDKTSNGTGEKFELAKKGARIEPKAEGNSINLANKFTALSSNN